ncbi:acyl-CoA dehydrogenase family protein [Ideonella sp. BYS139W]|uniref:Acyl-CoA dehydrogenase family protein n=2 Tax=Pseudaquabacterium rugosum TaxID=2984194 RepID=A0ABU9BEN6_9BURK
MSALPDTLADPLAERPAPERRPATEPPMSAVSTQALAATATTTATAVPPQAPASRTTIADLDGADWQALLADIRARRQEFTAAHQIAPDVIAAFKRLGVYRALVPAALGGDGLGPRAFCEMVERVAQADGSAGWVASFGMGVTYLAALPPATLARLYADGPDLVFAGGIFPPQRAPRVDGGFEVSGRWEWSSGCLGADVLGVGIAPVDPPASAEGPAARPSLPRMAVLPRAQVHIERAWDVTGLVGTGSHDLVVERQFVAEDHTFVRGSRAQRDEATFRYPTLSFATQVLSVVGLGIARGAIEELKRLALDRPSVTGAPRLADRPLVQIELARAEAQLRAARAFFYDAIDAAWATLQTGAEQISAEQTRLLRLSSTHAARTGAEVARAIQLQTGMSGVYHASPISQQVRDAQVLTQHAFMGDITYQNAGAMAFGLPPLPGFL